MATFNVDTLSDDPAAGLTLREALVLVDGAAGADTIQFAATIQGGTITLTGGQLTVASDVTIDGGTGITIDANKASRVLFVAGGSDADPNAVTLDSLTITGGETAEERGGGIWAVGDTSVTLTDSTVSGNCVKGDNGYGGGIYAGGSLALTGSTISVNSAADFGGGISARGSLTVTDSTVSGNVARIGGGIDAQSGIVTLTRSAVSGNYAGGRGGGFNLNESAVTLNESTVSSNRTAGNGGGIAMYDGGTVTLNDSTVSDNRAGRGGGIHVITADVTLAGSTVDGNSSTFEGGGIYAINASLTLTSSTVSGNSTTGPRGEGGGIFAGTGTLAVTHSTISGNSTAGSDSDGGGIALFVVPGTVTIANSIVSGNAAAASADPDLSGTIGTSNGHNLFGSVVAGAVAGDVQNADPSSIFAALDAVTGGGLLASNGGPTQTIALLDDASNPALGSGADLGLTTDQRGFSRPGPAGTDPDIGAFELGGLPPSQDIVGTPGQDFLKGTAGDDVMRGLANADILWGQGGDDQLFGGNGKDTLFGKAGIDQLTGGLGADRFVLRAAAEAAPDGPDYEEILDFNRSQGDKIDLRTIDANGAKPGNQPFKFIGGDPLTGPAQLSVADFAGDVLVTGSTDADAAAEFTFLVRTGPPGLQASDFLL